MVKIKEKGYKNKYLKNFNQLKDKLMLLFTDNPNSRNFEFYGVSKEGRLGMLVCGTDSKGIFDFRKFFPVSDIEFHYEELNTRLQRR